MHFFSFCSFFLNVCVGCACLCVGTPSHMWVGYSLEVTECPPQWVSTLAFFLFKRIILWCVWVFDLPHVYLSVQHVCAVSTETRKGHWIPRTELSSYCEPACGCCEEWSLFLITEACLQPPTLVSEMWSSTKPEVCCFGQTDPLSGGGVTDVSYHTQLLCGLWGSRIRSLGLHKPWPMEPYPSPCPDFLPSPGVTGTGYHGWFIVKLQGIFEIIDPYLLHK